MSSTSRKYSLRLPGVTVKTMKLIRSCWRFFCSLLFMADDVSGRLLPAAIAKAID